MANDIGTVIEDVSEYIEVKTELIKLKILGRLAKTTSGIVSISLILILGVFFILFLSFAVAHLINEATQSTYLGFIAISGFYLILIILIFFMIKRKSIQKLFEKLMLKIVESDEDESDN